MIESLIVSIRRGRAEAVCLTSAFFVVLAVGLGCSAPAGHFVNPKGQSLLEMDHLWEEVDEVFPGALPRRVKLVWVGGLHSSFMIDTNAIGVPSHMKSNIRQGKICRMLTHLALHRLSGGDTKTPGRCFDNDVVFLEQAIAGYLDRKGAGILEVEQQESAALAARMFRDGSLTLSLLRDWEAFYYRGFWSDQYKEWNLDGLRALVSLGDYLERTVTLSRMGAVFQGLDEDITLDASVLEHLGMSLDTLLNGWREEVLASNPEESSGEQAEPEPAEPESAGSQG
ncbi:MAG: hypothetical protein ACYTG7_07545 [Planctomycetota bacterium]|jgi:hypothetical protein